MFAWYEMTKVSEFEKPDQRTQWFLILYLRTNRIIETGRLHSKDERTRHLSRLKLGIMWMWHCLLARYCRLKLRSKHLDLEQRTELIIGQRYACCEKLETELTCRCGINIELDPGSSVCVSAGNGNTIWQSCCSRRSHGDLSA